MVIKIGLIVCTLFAAGCTYINMSEDQISNEFSINKEVSTGDIHNRNKSESTTQGAPDIITDNLGAVEIHPAPIAPVTDTAL